MPEQEQAQPQLQPQEPRRLRIQRLPHQRDLLRFGFASNGAPDPQRQDWKVALVAANGQGKTWALYWKAYQLARLNRGVPGLMVVPTYGLFRTTHLEEWPAKMAEIGVWLRWKASDQAFMWPWGDKTYVRTAEEPQRIVSMNVGWLAGDEPGIWADEAFDNAIKRVRHPQAKLRLSVFTGTPEGTANLFARWFARPDAAKRRATIWGRTWHPDMAHYRQTLLDLYAHDPSLLAAYAEGRFVPLRRGRMFGPFNRDVHVHAVEYIPDCPLVVTCDFNVDHMRWLVMQFPGDAINVLDEIALGWGGSTEEAAREVGARWGELHRGHVMVTGDAAGKARSTKTAATTTDYTVIEEVLSQYFENLDLPVPAANPSVKDSVVAVNYHLGGRGLPVNINPVCEELAQDLEAGVWKQGSSIEQDKTDPERTHSSDAFRYAVWQFAQPDAQRIVLSHGRVSGGGNLAYETF